MSSKMGSTLPFEVSNSNGSRNAANSFWDLKIRHVLGLDNLPWPTEFYLVKSAKQGQFNVECDPGDAGLPSVHENEIDIRKGERMCPADRCSNGYVTFCTKKGVEDMVQNLSKLSHGTSGCVMDEGLCPEGDKYEEFDHFCEHSKVGKGSYGDVRLCVDTHSQKRFVIKKIKKKHFHKSEVIVPLRLKHQNIVQIYGVIQRDDIDGQPVIEIMLEHAGVSLTQFMITYKNFLPQRRIWDLSKQALSALMHLDDHGIIHLDIKPDNICINITQDKSLLLKLADFGSSCCLNQEPLQFLGNTPEYMAPEVCKAVLNLCRATPLSMCEIMAITGKVDSYACGLVIAFMYSRCHLVNVQMATNYQESFAGVEPGSKNKKSMQLISLIATQLDLLESLIPKQCDEDMHELLTRLTEHDHSKRWSAEQALTYICNREQRIAKQLSEIESKKYSTRNSRHDYRSHPYKTEKVGKALGSKGMKLVVLKTRCQDSLQTIQELPMKHDHVEFISSVRNNSVMDNVFSVHTVPKTLDPGLEVQEGDLTEVKQLVVDKATNILNDKLWPAPAGLAMPGYEIVTQERNYDTQMVPSIVVSGSHGNTIPRHLHNCQSMLPQQPTHKTVQEILAQQQPIHGTQLVANKVPATQLLAAGRNVMIGQAWDIGYYPRVNNNSNHFKKEQAKQKTLNAVKKKAMLNMAKKHVTLGVTAKTAKTTGPEIIMSQGSPGKMNTASKSMDIRSPVQLRGNDWNDHSVALDHSNRVDDRATANMSVDLTQQEEQMGNLPMLDQLLNS